MEQVRNKRLDNLCEALGEVREQMAQQRADESGSMQAALAEMRAKNLTTYRHAGVELARVPGEEKLRVRTSKAQATAEVDEEPEAAAEVGDDVLGTEGDGD